MYYQPVNVEDINMRHGEIFECINNGDFDGAANLMRKHLQFDMVYALNAYQEAQKKKA